MYYRHVSSKETYRKIDSAIFKAIMRWINRRHPGKSTSWKKKKYFIKIGNRDWLFSTKIFSGDTNKQYLKLFNTSDITIKRHIKIRAAATPYDMEFQQYFKARKEFKKRKQTKVAAKTYAG